MIQQIVGDPVIVIMEQMVLFHVYAAFRLCRHSCFDFFLNNKHLSECLNILTLEYDVEAVEEPQAVQRRLPRRAAFEAVYLMHNLKSQHAITRFGSLPTVVARHPDVRSAFQFTLSCQTGNFYKVLSQVAHLPPYSLASVSPHIPSIQLSYMQIMRVAFASRASTVPLVYLRRTLCPFEEDAVADEYITRLCQQLQVRVERSQVFFTKSKSPSGEQDGASRPPSPRIWSALDRRLKGSSVRDLIRQTCTQ